MRPELLGLSRTHPKPSRRVGSHFPFLGQIRSGYNTFTPTLRNKLHRDNSSCRPSQEGGRTEDLVEKKRQEGGSAASRPGARHWRLNIKCREKSISTALLAISDASFQRERFEFRDGTLPLFSCPAAFGASVDGTTGRG